ncbi:MAG: tRNA 4-thiouridine(8) synthase ThiI [Clostridiales Family XIII bacterium]|jgi:thiamine biosynthesis protein ThiI|nr:tRNA 4-thiouridine(8) synthase ThiI [Clostridiales Family XIII bacterium]
MNENQNVFIVRCGEVALKGLNKPYFERMLVERARKLLRIFDNVQVTRREGLIFVYADAKHPPEAITREISKVFGVASISPAVETESDLDVIGAAAAEYMRGRMERDGVKTFKVEAKRADKSFPVQSPDIARIIGAEVLKAREGLKVDVHEPDCLLFVDLRKDKTYIYDQKIAGFGGLPLGTNGRGLVLLSGGIDSPVAAFMMAKRGMRVDALHFHSYPYTSNRARDKVEELARLLAAYCGRFELHVINLLPIQEQLAERCPEDEMTILVRRFMMRIGERVAEKIGCGMLITGESLGQVASQTAESLTVTDAATKMPVMRPLIGLDKVDIMDKAREIGTYETSILPYEDCCTVFLPKRPVTKPKLARILESESKVDAERLIDEAVASAETVIIRPGPRG